MDLATILPYVIGIVLTIIGHKFGLPVPGLPKPGPGLPPASPEADKPLVECLAWLISAKSGEFKLDDKDRETLKAIKPLVDALAGESK